MSRGFEPSAFSMVLSFSGAQGKPKRVDLHVRGVSRLTISYAWETGSNSDSIRLDRGRRVEPAHTIVRGCKTRSSNRMLVSLGLHAQFHPKHSLTRITLMGLTPALGDADRLARTASMGGKDSRTRNPGLCVTPRFRRRALWLFHLLRFGAGAAKGADSRKASPRTQLNRRLSLARCRHRSRST